MPKIAFYTTLYSFDKPIDIPGKFPTIPGFDYFLFTNLPKEKLDTSWDIMQTDNFFHNTCLSARYIKWNIHKFLEDYDYVIYMDAYKSPNPERINEFLEYINMLKTFDIIIMSHNKRNCIYDEIKSIIKYRKDTKDKTNKNLKALLDDKYPKNNGLFSAGFFFKNNKNIVLNGILEKLFIFMKDKSHRDQIAINYVFWKESFINYRTFDFSNYDKLLDSTGKKGLHKYTK